MARRKETPEEAQKRKEDLERRAKRSAEINTWKPKNSEEVITESDGNIFIVNFDKVFHDPEAKKYNNFCIKKSSYEDHLKTYSRYINYFINKYDPDDELVTAYFKLKYMIDLGYFTKDNVNALIDAIYDIIFTPSICDKITRMVHDNYLDDIERPSTDDYKHPADDKYLESLEFKNIHIEILLRISMAYKIIVPVAYHYFTKNHLKPDELTVKKDVNIMYSFNKKAMDIFQGDECNMFNKLYVYIKRKVIDSNFHNEKIFRQREIFGDDPGLLIEKFVKKQLIGENIVKYHFNEVWDPKKKKYKENPIGLNKTIIKYQLLFFAKEIYSKTLTEMTNTRDSDGLSASDKMEMNLSKRDNGILVLAAVNMKDTIRRLESRGIKVPEEEIQYYIEHTKASDIQTQMFRSIYSKEFMSYRDQYIVPRHETTILKLILKKRLILEAMCDPNKKFEDVVLPYILTGNVSGKVNTRMVRNSKLLAKIEDDSDYDYLVHHKYKELEELQPGYIKSIISTFIYTKFTYNTWERPELTGQEIYAPEDQICHEVIQFLKMV